MVYDLDLKNLNEASKNTPAIDLGDANKRISVPVTSDNSGAKVKKTIESFVKNGFYNDYDRLVLIMLVPKQGSYTGAYETQGKLKFSRSNDILDFSDIVNAIKKKNTDDIVCVRDYIENEYPSNVPVINIELLDQVKEIVEKIKSGKEGEVALDI